MDVDANDTVINLLSIHSLHLNILPDTINSSEQLYRMSSEFSSIGSFSNQQYVPPQC